MFLKRLCIVLITLPCHALQCIHIYNETNKHFNMHVLQNQSTEPIGPHQSTTFCNPEHTTLTAVFYKENNWLRQFSLVILHGQSNLLQCPKSTQNLQPEDHYCEIAITDTQTDSVEMKIKQA